MKRSLLALLVLAFSAVSYGQTDMTKDDKTKVGDQLPAFSFEIEAGKKVDIADYKGRLIVINLFATWCGPCNMELPQVQKLIWEKHKDNPRFAFFVFGREENWDKLDPYKKNKGFTFPIVPDMNRVIFSKFAGQGIPRNIIADENGKIIYQSIGYSEEEFQNMVKLIDSRLGALAAKK